MGIHENKLRTKVKYANGETQPTPDEQLTRLEEDIRRLRIEFDIFFNGAAKRPPYDTKGRVETVIKRLGDDRTLTFAQRFRYNSLTARYNAFRDLWRRIMQGREECRDPLSAARASVKEESNKRVDSVSFVCADAHKEVQTVKELYQSLVEAKRQCGENTQDLSFARFHSLIASKADGLKERFGCERVEFSVTVEDGHVSFKAKAD
ncbi:MAG TPA: MXAN_5187 C-terminal domain-containing protein [Pyrinomonadaceae bacterium]|nr:MXAN_5187 C-terminal domain-containing protein [Pyrinomonadaceae bacterium]